MAARMGYSMETLSVRKSVLSKGSKSESYSGCRWGRCWGEESGQLKGQGKGQRMDSRKE